MEFCTNLVWNCASKPCNSAFLSVLYYAERFLGHQSVGPWFQNELLGKRCKREIFAFVDCCKACDCFSFILPMICTSSSYGISSKLITFAFVTFSHESSSLFLYFFSKSIIILQLFFFHLYCFTCFILALPCSP